MVSVNARQVAIDVLETVRKGKKVKLGEIIKKNGYADTTSTVPTQVTNTKTYQQVISSVVNKWIKERDRLTKALSERDLSNLAYRDGIEAIDKLTKNIQLLTGNATENFYVIATIEEKESINKALDEIE